MARPFSEKGRLPRIQAQLLQRLRRDNYPFILPPLRVRIRLQEGSEYLDQVVRRVLG